MTCRPEAWVAAGTLPSEYDLRKGELIFVIPETVTSLMSVRGKVASIWDGRSLDDPTAFSDNVPLRHADGRVKEYSAAATWGRQRRGYRSAAARRRRVDRPT